MTQPSPLAVGDELPASWLDQLLTWLGATTTSYAPTLTAFTTNPTLGTGSSTSGRYTKIGSLVAGHGLITFGSSGVNAGSGVYFVSLPTAVDASLAVGTLLGTARIVCAGLNTRCDLYLNSAALGQCRLTYTSVAVNGTYVSATNAAPGAWAANDSITYQFRYPAG